MMLPRIAGLAILAGLALPAAASAMSVPVQVPDMSEIIRVAGGCGPNAWRGPSLP